MKGKQIIQKEFMNYKEQIKENELITKFKIIRDFKLNNISKVKIGEKYSMHRNSVKNIIDGFEQNIDPGIRSELLSTNKTFGYSELEEKLFGIKSKSRKPISNKRSANKTQEALIVDYHKNGGNPGYKKINMLLNRKLSKIEGVNQDKIIKDNSEIIKNNKSLNSKSLNSKSLNNKSLTNLDKNLDKLKGLTVHQIKGIFKRNNLKSRKKRSANNNGVALYDYKKLACFESLHYDTKEITDKKALPQTIYDKFKLNKSLPVFEWNIIDAKSRFRFLAYSHSRTSDFGLNFLIYTIQYIRANKIIDDNQVITIGTDNGSEFYSGSERKEKIWNYILGVMNANIYSYNPGFDIRKNLIERSHKTDDEEFFIPRGSFITGKKSFLLEAKGYFEYFNNLRPHTGIEMNKMTPIEKIKSCGVYNANRLLDFPTMILEDDIYEIMKCTDIIKLVAQVNQDRKSNKKGIGKYNEELDRFDFDQKYIMNMRANYGSVRFLENAQNVFEQYLFSKMS